MTDPEPLEPARRLIDEPTDDKGRLLGWRAKDLPDDDLSDDDYADQFTYHAPSVWCEEAGARCYERPPGADESTRCRRCPAARAD